MANRLLFPVFYVVFTALCVYLSVLLLNLPALEPLINQPLVMPIFAFCFFYSLPLSLAHYLAFIKLKRLNHDRTQNPVAYSISISIIIILGFSLANYLYSKTPKTTTYLNPNTHFQLSPSITPTMFITPTLTPAPTPFLPQSTLSGYYISKSFLYAPTGQPVWSEALPFNLDHLNDFFYDPSSHSLYVTLATDISIGNSHEEIAVYTYSSTTSYSKKVLSLHLPGMYAGTIFLKYFPDTNKFLLLTQGGDGCGGEGKVWFLSTSGSETPLQDFKSGCVNKGNLPDYVGFTGQLLIFDTYQPVSSDFSDPYWDHIASVYSLDPLTHTQETLIEASQMPQDVSWVTVSEDKSRLELYSNAKLKYNFNLSTKVLSPNNP